MCYNMIEHFNTFTLSHTHTFNILHSDSFTIRHIHTFKVTLSNFHSSIHSLFYHLTLSLVCTFILSHVYSSTLFLHSCSFIFSHFHFFCTFRLSLFRNISLKPYLNCRLWRCLQISTSFQVPTWWPLSLVDSPRGLVSQHNLKKSWFECMFCFYSCTNSVVFE